MSLSITRMRRRLAKPVQPAIASVSVPAPVNGLNTILPISQLGELDCAQLFNLIPSDNGLRSRLGSREWCTGLTGAADNLVRTMMSFRGSATASAKDRVFATTSSGIWDVTSSSAAPTQVLTFGTQTGDAGYGIHHATVTAAGHFLLYCDEVNGYHVYTESTDTWAVVTQGGGAAQVFGVDPATFRFVGQHKNRIVFAAADSQNLYYLDTGSAIYGTAHAFPLGLQFPAGGHLVGVWNWTYDGGNGMDDALVAVGAGGDLAIYLGTDLTSATTIALKGVWNVGGLPSGRDICSKFGGDLLILTKAGLLPLSRLVAGGSTEDSKLYETYRIGNLFNRYMVNASSLRGWAIRQNPEDASLLVTVPTYASQPTNQLAMSTANKGWSEYRDLPIYSAVTHAGKLYYGTVDGKVGIHDGYLDGVTLADPNAYTAIQWRCLTGFRNLGRGTQKQVQTIRTSILSEGRAAFDVAAKYRYDLTELASVSPASAGEGAWDSGLWDDAVWGGDYSATQELRGATGMGPEVAIAIRGTAVSRTVLVGFDVAYTEGGLL